jgi:peroxiredoxin Q/BCP
VLAIGAKAPEFTLNDQEGDAFNLSESLKQGPLILYFYPKDDTPG